MHNRYIVTITDTSGSKQYYVHKIIKKIILFTVLAFILISVITFFYIKFIQSKVDMLNVESKTLRDSIVILADERLDFEAKNKQLDKDNNNFMTMIQENNDKLASIKEHLGDVEEIVGIGPEMNASFISRVDKVKKQLKDDISKDIEEEKITAIQTALLLNSIPSGKPLKYKRVSSNFGYRTHPVTKRKSFHAGIDLPASHDTPIYAPASGTVMMAKKKGAYGNFLLLTHSYGFKTAYGHLSKFAVKSGDFVSKGQKIAYVGSTGRSTGPHLHYEIRYLTKWLDPKLFMNWDMNDINSITKKAKKVNWGSIFEQTKKLISISSQCNTKEVKSSDDESLKEPL